MISPEPQDSLTVTIAQIKIVRSMPRPDVSVRNEGSIFLFTPNTDRGKAWIDENISSDSTWWGQSLVVEHRYAGAIIKGLERAGLTFG